MQQVAAPKEEDTIAVVVFECAGETVEGQGGDALIDVARALGCKKTPLRHPTDLLNYLSTLEWELLSFTATHGVESDPASGPTNTFCSYWTLRRSVK